MWGSYFHSARTELILVKVLQNGRRAEHLARTYWDLRSARRSIILSYQRNHARDWEPPLDDISYIIRCMQQVEKIHFLGNQAIADWRIVHKRQRRSNGTPKYNLELTLVPRKIFWYLRWAFLGIRTVYVDVSHLGS